MSIFAMFSGMFDRPGFELYMNKPSSKDFQNTDRNTTYVSTEAHGDKNKDMYFKKCHYTGE